MAKELSAETFEPLHPFDGQLVCLCGVASRCLYCGLSDSYLSGLLRIDGRKTSESRMLPFRRRRA